MGRWIIIILGLIPGAWSGKWGVTYENQCALKGTSVDLKCEYDYSFGNIVTWVSWSKAQQVSNGWTRVPLSNLPSPSNHFKYIGNYNRNCNLRINNVLSSDEGAYYFNFATTLGSWISDTYASLSVRGNNTRTYKHFSKNLRRFGSDSCFSESVTELISVVQPSIAREGDAVKLICRSGCSEPKMINWFKDGQRVQRPEFLASREDAGSYYCAIQGEETVRSASVALNVHYYPMNVSVSVNPEHIAKGSRVNLTCISDANPAADNYTWYKRTEPISSISLVHVGSGQVLSLPSMESSHSGLYVCYARNSLGEGNSTEVVVAMAAEQHGCQSLPILAGVGLFLIVMLVAALLLFWKKQKSEADITTNLDSRLHGRATNSEEPTEAVYSNIHIPPSSPLPISDPYSTPASRGDVEKNTLQSSENEIIYSTVTIKPTNQNSAHHKHSWSKGREDDSAVIYSSVVKSS
ncbi:B-cell receptor CD22-like [Anableps anableps]